MTATKAHIRATTKYEAKAYGKVLLRLRNDSDVNVDTLKAIASATGTSVNGFITDAIREKIERDGLDLPDLKA